jgi:hypothetical protein
MSMGRPKEGWLMRRLFLAGVLSLVVAALGPGIGLATHSNGNGPTKDFISGSAKGDLPTPLGTFLAHYHANGQSKASIGTPAEGSWFADIFTDGTFASLGTVSISGSMICLNAVGHGANWRGIIEDSNQPGLFPPGFGILSRWVDNGEGQGTEDLQVGYLTPPPGPNPTCPPTPFVAAPNRQGNLVVHDGI